jgi:microcin C transport system ATP-binding protein
VGESGSGKTVTALSLLRLVEAARLDGRITLRGPDVLRMTAPELQQLRGRDIAVIFQEPMTALNPYLPWASRSSRSAAICIPTSRAGGVAGAVAALARVGIPSRKCARAAIRTSCPAASASAR